MDSVSAAQKFLHEILQGITLFLWGLKMCKINPREMDDTIQVKYILELENLIVCIKNVCF